MFAKEKWCEDIRRSLMSALLLSSLAALLTCSAAVGLVRVVPKSTDAINGYAFDVSGDLYVLYLNGSIYRYSNGAATLFTQFSSSLRMRSLAFDYLGNAYTGDYYGHLYRVRPDGTYSVLAYGLWSIQGITADSGGNVYVVAAYNRRIYKVRPDGSITPWATVGSGSDFLESIALDEDAGYMYLVVTSGTNPPLYTYIVRIPLSNPSLHETVAYISGLRCYSSYSLYVRPDGKLLLAGVYNHYTDSEAGVYLVDPATGAYEYFIEPQPGLYLLGVTADPSGELYLVGRWYEGSTLYYSIFRVSAAVDETPPVTSIQLEGAQGLSGWYVSDVVVTLTASDEESGVDRTEYSFDGSTWMLYTAPFTLGEGVHTVYYRSVDKAGNVEEPGSVVVKVDYTPPTTSSLLSGDWGEDGWSRADVTWTLTASDGLSGVNATYYRVNGGAWTEYAGALTFVEEGFYTLEYYSVDEAGNVEQVRSTSFALDKTPPELALSFDAASMSPVAWGVDNMDSDVEVQVYVEDSTWSYLLSDSAGNTLKVVMEVHGREGKVLHMRFINATYVSGSGVEEYTFPDNAFNAVRVSNKRTGGLRALIQHFGVDDLFTVNARYNERSGVTKILIAVEGEEPSRHVVTGLWLITAVTNRGTLSFAPPE